MADAIEIPERGDVPKPGHGHAGASIAPQPAKKGRPQWVWAIGAAGLSGLLLAGCFWPLNLHFLAWIALVPWLVVLPRLGPTSAWVCGAILGLVFYRAGLDWLLTMYGAIGAGAAAILAVLLGFSFRVAVLLVRRLGLGAMLWAVPLAYTAQEIIRSEGLPLLRFSHLVLGYTQIHNPWVAQIASLGGVFGLSFLIVAFNAALAYGIIRRTWRSFMPALGVAGAVVLLAACAQPPSYAGRREIPVAAVQHERPDYPEFARLTAQAAADVSRPRIIVLPEHTITELAKDEDHTPLLPALKDTAATSGAYICVGAHAEPPRLLPQDPSARSRFLADPANRRRFQEQCWYDNVAMLVSPEGRVVFKQLKVVPVPFLQDGNPAQTQQVFAAPCGRLGLYVCYDESFSDVMRRLADQGAELLLGPILNKESWPLQQRMQQADMIPLRAIELRRCMVRAASSGVSQIIDATGRVRASRLQADGPGVLLGSVYRNDERTVFARGGWVFGLVVGWAFMGIVILLTLWGWGQGIVRLVLWAWRRIGKRPSAQGSP